MTEVKIVKLAKRSTADGLLQFMDDVPLGKKYAVLTEPILMQGVHRPTGTYWQRSMYQCVEGGWLPVEVFEESECDG